MRNPDASTIGEALIWQAAHRPDKRAFLFLERGERETESLTFGELDLRARAIAQVLHDNKLCGQRVILTYPSCLEFVAALFGCFYAGVTAVPAPVASYGNSLARIRTILADAEAAAVLSLRSLLSTEAEQPSGAAGLHIPEVIWIATDEIANSGACLPQPVEPGALALLQYTSGSTGSPRGVMLTHSNLIHNQRVLARAFDSSAGDIGVSWLPLYHDMGLMSSVLHSVYQGGFCVLMPPLSIIQKPIRWLKAIDRYRASISGAPCFAYDLCARRNVPGNNQDLDLSSWRVAICGGEAIRPQVLEKFAETFRTAGFDSKALLPAYGLAEATLLATSSPAGSGMTTIGSPDAVAGDAGGGGNAWLRQLACCGQTWEEQRVAVVDPDSCRRLPPDQVGEIWAPGSQCRRRILEPERGDQSDVPGQAGR